MFMIDRHNVENSISAIDMVCLAGLTSDSVTNDPDWTGVFVSESAAQAARAFSQVLPRGRQYYIVLY